MQRSNRGRQMRWICRIDGVEVVEQIIEIPTQYWYIQSFYNWCGIGKHHKYLEAWIRYFYRFRIDLVGFSKTFFLFVQWEISLMVHQLENPPRKWWLWRDVITNTNRIQRFALSRKTVTWFPEWRMKWRHLTKHGQPRWKKSTSCERSWTFDRPNNWKIEKSSQV